MEEHMKKKFRYGRLTIIISPVAIYFSVVMR